MRRAPQLPVNRVHLIPVASWPQLSHPRQGGLGLGRVRGGGWPCREGPQGQTPRARP